MKNKTIENLKLKIENWKLKIVQSGGLI